jgi:hypothetical protein
MERLLPALMFPLQPFTDALASFFVGVAIVETISNADHPEFASHPPAKERLTRMFEFLDGKNYWSLRVNEPRKIMALGDRLVQRLEKQSLSRKR